jgi:hypothetical protein
VHTRGGEVLQEVRERGGGAVDFGEEDLCAFVSVLLVWLWVEGRDTKEGTDTTAMITTRSASLSLCSSTSLPIPACAISRSGSRFPCLSVPFSSISRVEYLSRVSCLLK